MEVGSCNAAGIEIESITNAEEIKCGITHKACLNPKYRGTECYTKECPNIKLLDKKEKKCQKKLK